MYDPHSPQFRHFLGQRELTARFGPTRKAYNKVLAYLRRKGLTLVQGSANRLTLTLRGTRAQAERAFRVGIADYFLQDRTFFAGDQNPALPATIASDVFGISGLSNLARPAPAEAFFNALCTTALIGPGLSALGAKGASAYTAPFSAITGLLFRG